MVPEWKGLLDMEALSRLEKSVKANNYQDVSNALDDLSEGCKSCHRDYRAVTAAIYRAPDFSSLKINTSMSFKEHMKKLTKDVNQIKIASEDGMKDLALSSLTDLKNGIDLLGETCVSCHKKGSKTYPNDMVSKTIGSLEESLKTGTAKEQGRYLGTLAVLACARCHGTHRLSYDSRGIFSDEPDWLEMMKH
jgi:cytochrome c556